MAKKKIKKSAKRRLTLLTPIVILAVGYFAVTLVTTVIEIYQLNKEEATLKIQLNELQGDSEELKTEITKLQDKDYIARYARENYLYTKDGEYVIKVDETNTETDENNFKIDEEYIMYIGMAIALLIIIYIIIKHNKKKKKN